MQDFVKMFVMVIVVLLSAKTAFASKAPTNIVVCGQKVTVISVKPQRVPRNSINRANDFTIESFVKLTSKQIADLNSVKNNKLAGVFSKSFVIEEMEFQSCKIAKKETKKDNSHQRVVGAVD